MARSLHVAQSEFPYHVVAKTINGDWFSVPIERVWEIMSEQLYFIHRAYDLNIISFVLMSNHFHLLIRTPRANLSEAMGWFMRETSRSLTEEANRENQTWAGRYYRSVIRPYHHFLHAYKYVYANPLKAGIVARAEMYPYSTLNGLLGFRRLIIPVEEDTTLFSDLAGTIEWLNTAPSEQNWQTIRAALRKSVFQLRKNGQVVHPLELSRL